MLKVDSSLLRSLGIYSVANLLNAGIPFLLLPFLTAKLSPADYGLLAIFQILLSLAVPFTGMNAEGALSRKYFDKDSHIDFSSYVSNGLYLTVIGTAIISIIFFFLGSKIEGWTTFPSKWLWVILLCAFSHNITEILLAIWRVQYKSIQFGVFRILKTLLEFTLSILLIYYIEANWESRIIGQLLSSLLFGLIAFYFFYKQKQIGMKLDKKRMFDIMRFGLPLIPHVVGGIVIAMSDRIFITKMVGLHETGLYSVGFQVGQMISLIQNSFNQAWVPYFYEKLNLKSETTNKKIVKFTYVYFVIMLILALGLTLIAPTFFSLFIGKNYVGAIPYVFWISLGFSFDGMYKMVVNYFFYIEKTYFVSIITFFTAIVNIGLNFLLIKLNGAIGAAQATAISLFIEFILVWILVTRKYKMPWLYFLKKSD